MLIQWSRNHVTNRELSCGPRILLAVGMAVIEAPTWWPAQLRPISALVRSSAHHQASSPSPSVRNLNIKNFHTAACRKLPDAAVNAAKRLTVNIAKMHLDK
jgi:hypothetical protein